MINETVIFNLECYAPALQIRAGQRSITAILRPLTAHIYHVMIIMTGGFSKKSFMLSFPGNSFEQSRTCYLHFYKIHRTILLSFYLLIFYSLFRNRSVLCCPPFRTFPLRVNTLDESVFFLLVVCILTFVPFVLFASQAVLKRKLKTLILPPIHSLVKFNKYLYL